MSAALLDRQRTGIGRLASFVEDVSNLLNETDDEETILRRGSNGLAELIAADDWLPDAYAAPDPVRYRQYLLHRDARARFSVVSFVWGPGQATPIHDHTVWGLVGVLRGGELAERFAIEDGELVSVEPPRLLRRGAVDAVSPRIGDVHRVANAFDDRVSVSIHVYGTDIGQVERSIIEPNGLRRPFVSGYADLPPLIA